MRHVFLRFTYGVEIGARLAYLGHYARTGDPQILKIANEELEHRNQIEQILTAHGKRPFFLFNWFFLAVGHTIKALCTISPSFMLNFVAEALEIFAVVSYNKLARLYPGRQFTFWKMAIAEKQHEAYFRKLRNGYEIPVTTLVGGSLYRKTKS